MTGDSETGDTPDDASEGDDRLRELEQLCEGQQQQLQHCRKLLDLQIQDRKLFVLEIHDGFVQQCTGALMLLESLAAEVLSQSQPWDEKLTRGIELLRSSLDEARRLMRGLRPPGLEQHGLLPPLQALLADFQDRLGLEVRFECPQSIPRLDSSAELGIYRIVQEALHNVWKHANCPQATVKLAIDNEGLSVSITDHGKGFDPGNVCPDRLGLAGIAERARSIGGIAQIASSPNAGTRIQVSLPHSALSNEAKSDL
jgi:signal transduction histidine kinase